MAIPVRAFELGERPAVLTKARTNAPQACIVLADLLANVQFGDAGVVVLDWEDSMGQQPVETRKPVIFIQLHKWLPGVTENNHLTVESRLDVDDVFGGVDYMTNSLLRDIVFELQEKAKESLAKAAVD